LCEKFNQLPYSGGVLEQPAGAVRKLESIIDARSKLDEKDDAVRKMRENGAKNV